MGTKEKVIEVEGISKRYRIGLKEEMHDSFLSATVDFIKSPIKNYRKYRSLYKFDDYGLDQNPDSVVNSDDVIWALKDVSFEVKRGEVLGIIGGNGAGKSTLLKILSKITSPSQGRAQIRGRISSLLEVGTGFHPELTGRENIYLNGTILGMRKEEIDDKYDEIVEFSGVEKFLDTPVKRYSVGMKIRLGFSVAAFLEPDILIVDEVLAVGDIEFQKKCLNKMETVGERGRTVLFVSHNMQTINRLCSRAILLEDGRLKDDDLADKVVASYLTSETVSTSERTWNKEEEAPGGDVARLLSVRIKDNHGQVFQSFDIRKPIGIEMEYEILKSGFLLLPHHNLFNEEGGWIFTTIDTDPDWRGLRRPLGKYTATAWIPGNLLSEGIIFVNTLLFTLEPRTIQFDEKDVVSFQVVDSIDGDNTARGDWAGPMRGAVRPHLEWTNRYEKPKSSKF
jgi:lipopolysaccharide transport system ATP-binding protein